MKLNHLLSRITICVIISSAHLVNGQNPVSDDDMYELSLEELLNIPIHSASKKEEMLFDAPLSSYTVTRSDIERSGVTSIMEALRLVPGLIVREQSNGVYDIHIRGLDNLLRYSQAFTKNNMNTLVMIDSRPAFNHNLGGTFWEALPIDVLDVERIEIVRGPSAPLFGPNAVTGVVNIITRRAESSHPVVSANVEGGSPSTLIGNAYVGRRFNSKWASSLSFNFQDRSRYDDSHYNTLNGTYEAGEDFIANYSQAFPQKTRAMRKTGVNAYLQYTASEKAKFDLSMGYQDSESLKNMLASFGTVLNNSTATSMYANLNARISQLTVRTSVINGKDNILYGGNPSRYDYTVADLNAEYDFKLSEKINIVPGINVQNAEFSDEAYFGEAEKGFLNGTQQSISTISGFLRTDINATDRLRVLAALRADKFSTPDDLYLAYELASTYKLNNNNLIRMAVTRSNSGAFMGYNKVNYVARNEFHLGGGMYIDQIQRGNPSLELLTVNMIEVGFRSKMSSKFQLDMDIFHQRVRNLTTTIIKGFSTYPPTPAADFIIEFDNVPVEATQLGATIGLNFVPNSRWQIKPFLTIQSTETKNLPDSFFDPALTGAQPGAGFPPVTYSDSKHKYTPAAYGGYYVNFKATEKLNVNMNAYFLSNQTWYRAVDTTVESGSQFMLNAKVNYALTGKFNIYVNGRNLLNTSDPQFLGGDRLGALVLGGVSLNLK